MVAHQIRWWRTRRRFRTLMSDSLRCRVKSDMKGSHSAVLRALRLTTLAVTDFGCVSNFSYGTVAHILRTGTTFEALIRVGIGGSASATWPTRPHREIESTRFTVRDHRFSGRRTRKRLCRCSFWVAAPDTRHWKPSLYPTQTAQRKFSLNRVRRRHGPFPPRRPLTGLAGSTRWRCTFREASTCSSSLAGSIPPAAIAQRRGLQPSYEELP